MVPPKKDEPQGFRLKRSFTIKILRIKNLTTRFLLENSRIPNRMNPLISFNQVLEDGIVLDIPRNTCSQGHSLEIQMETEGAREREITMNVTAKVIHLESASGPHLTVFLKFVQFHKEDWEKIQSEFDGHQEAVENLFKNMKSG